MRRIADPWRRWPYAVFYEYEGDGNATRLFHTSRAPRGNRGRAFLDRQLYNPAKKTSTTTNSVKRLKISEKKLGKDAPGIRLKSSTYVPKTAVSRASFGWVYNARHRFRC
jgi:hypothetical protein